MTYRILAMDGGNAGRTGVFLSDMQRRAESLEKTFLSEIDLFAGSSSGGISAMLLAWSDDPLEALEAILRFDDEVRQQAPAGPLTMAGTVLGTCAALDPSKIKEFCDQTFGEAAIMADLKRPVLIPAVQLDSEDVSADVMAPDGTVHTPERRWSTKLFTNMPGDPGASDLIADVALRTMAMPMQYPIYQSVTGIGPGYVDGGVFANNPALSAVTYSLAQQKLEDMTVLSLGVPRSLAGGQSFLDPDMHNGAADWGYRQWMLDPGHPLLLADLFIQAGVDAVNTQCGQLLGDRYVRFEPKPFEGAFWDRKDDTDELDANFATLDKLAWFGSKMAPAPASQPA